MRRHEEHCEEVGYPDQADARRQGAGNLPAAEQLPLVAASPGGVRVRAPLQDDLQYKL